MNELDWAGLGFPAAPWERPTDVQQAVIPAIGTGRDVVAVAPTGTGKTAAYGLPSMVPGLPRSVLIVAPTRELANQIGQRLSGLADVGLAVVTGGVPRPVQRELLAKDPVVVVGTPGRLVDLHHRGELVLAGVERLVVDEADQLLDAGFQDDLLMLAAAAAARQTVLTSATLPPAVDRLVAALCTDPVVIRLDGPPPGALDQQVFFVAGNDRRALLLHLLEREEVERAVVFARTRKAVDALARSLPDARVLHGERTQAQRDEAVARFREHGGVLLATDVAARGLDLPAVTHVVNVGLPYDTDTYVHRVGRTARAGRDGVAWSLCTADDGGRLRDLERATGTPLAPVLDHPWSDLTAIPDSRATASSRRGRRRGPARGPRRRGTNS